MEGQRTNRFWDEGERRAELGHIVDGELKRRAEMEGQDAKSILEAYYETAEVEELIFDPAGARHWGIWHPERSWATTGPGGVMAFRSKAVAEAQRDALVFVMRGLSSIDTSLYEVRCIEEWADEQSG